MPEENIKENNEVPRMHSSLSISRSCNSVDEDDESIEKNDKDLEIYATMSATYEDDDTNTDTWIEIAGKQGTKKNKATVRALQKEKQRLLSEQKQEQYKKIKFKKN